MTAEDHANPVEDPIVDHRERAGPLLLRGLKHQSHRQRGWGAGDEQRGGSEHDAGVHVVTTRVHHPIHTGGKRQLGFLLDGQRIHVAANCHHPLARARALDVRDDPMTAYPGAGLQIELTELRHHPPRGALLVTAELRVPMEVAAYRDHAVEDVGGNQILWQSLLDHGYTS